MENLRWVGIGMIIVALDLRFNGIDFATDAVGWVIALLGLLALAKMHPGFAISTAGAGVGLVAWAAHPWLGVGKDVAELAELVAQTSIVFATCTALMSLVPQKRSSANVIRWADLGIGIVALLAIAALRDTDGAALLVVPLVLIGLGIFIAFLVLLFRCARLGPQRPVSHPAG